MISTRRVSAEDWKKLSEDAHLVCFDEKRPASMDRIDFAILNVDHEGTLLNYCTVRELDDETCYWQYGGAFPSSKGTVHSAKSYARNIKWTFDQGYKRISTYIENTNSAMLRIALRCGFRVIGMRVFHGAIFLECQVEAPVAS